MAWDNGIDPKTVAYKIAADASQKVRVLAGPGTGKSYAIKLRITRLLDEDQDPKKMLAVTFTRMSAADLVRDIRSLAAPGSDAVCASTLHSECFRILGKNSVIKITGRHPRPLAAFEFEPLLADLQGDASGRDKDARRKLISAYEAAWARLQHEHPGIALTPEDQKFEDALIDWLKFHRAMLIGELVPFAYKYLRDNPAAPELSKYFHVLVDEYQDLNKAEQEVAAQLATNGHLIIVGDDDQSIYTFKNAHRVGIIEFPNAHPGTSDHTMDECQRCPSLVVSMANSLIAKNRTRPAPPRSLKPIARKGNGVAEVFHFGEHAEEINYLAKRIRQFTTDGVPPGQIIVLCQSRDYIRGLYGALQNAAVPSELCYQESQFDEEGAKEKMAFLSLAGDQDDRVALRYLVGVGSNDWRTAQWAKIRQASVVEGKSPWDILSEMKAGTRPTTGVKALFNCFKGIQTQLAGFTGLTGNELVNAWLPTGSPCTELKALADTVAADDPDCDAKKLAEKVREIVTEPEIPDVVPNVRIMSLHKSKGLSANVVIIAGCVEGIVPRERRKEMTDADYAESIEEARRLFFVGLTRVKAEPTDGRPGHLIISASRKVPTAIAKKGVAIAGWEGGMARTINSCFLSELGPDSPKPVKSPVAPGSL
jgi:DNA helicase-2/ATP-dependent DNA helicase PcrA